MINLMNEFRTRRKVRIKDLSIYLRAVRPEPDPPVARICRRDRKMSSIWKQKEINPTFGYYFI